MHRQVEDSFDLHFTCTADMSCFLTGPTPLGRSCISSLKGHWGVPSAGSDLSTYAGHTDDNAAERLFRLLARECTNLQVLDLTIDFDGLMLYHADGRERESILPFAGAPGMRELRDLRRAVEARRNSCVRVKSREHKLQVRLDNLLA